MYAKMHVFIHTSADKSAHKHTQIKTKNYLRLQQHTHTHHPFSHTLHTSKESVRERLQNLSSSASLCLSLHLSLLISLFSYSFLLSLCVLHSFPMFIWLCFSFTIFLSLPLHHSCKSPFFLIFVCSRQRFHPPFHVLSVSSFLASFLPGVAASFLPFLVSW